MVSGWLFARFGPAWFWGGLSVLRGAPRHLELAPVAFRREKPAKTTSDPTLAGQSPDQGGTERTCAIWIKLIGTRTVRIQPRARVAR